ncbi:MAG TPA: hypothetical protein VLI93_02460 [Acetobacteraceae bacterium]|nr:hypothetical protein [Acetobacteraceae bacterium]
MLEELLKRGDAMLALGDISGARSMYIRAAEGGSARAARQVGETYDPAFLSRVGTAGMSTDSAAAATWYRKAIALGDAEAAARLTRLSAASP